MQQSYNLVHLILTSVVILGLTLLMVCIDAQAQIAFVSERDGNPEIYAMNINGGNQRNLTNNPHDDWCPSWSPDGKRIVFTSDRDGNREIYVLDINGGNQRNLTNNPHDDTFPAWSLNGERIAFMSKRDVHIVDFALTYEIYVMDNDGKNQQKLTNNRGNDTAPAWYNPACAVVPAGKMLTMWGMLKQID